MYAEEIPNPRKAPSSTSKGLVSDWFSLDDERVKSSEELLVRIQARPGSYDNLGRLIQIDPKHLSPSGRIDYLAALEKQYSWLYSLIQEATLAIAGSEPTEAENIWEGVDESEREDVATALRLSPSTAQIRIDVARTLSKYLPATCAALANGEISSSHATLIARETASAIERGIDPSAISPIESKALAHSEFHTAAQVGRRLKTLFAQYAPEDFEERVQIARDTRKVSIFPEGDGMSTLLAILPSEDAQLVFLAINEFIDIEAQSNACIKANPDPARIGENQDSQAMEAFRNQDFRSIEMKRADALTALAVDFLNRISGDEERTTLGFKSTKISGIGAFPINNAERAADRRIARRKPVSLNLTMDLPTLLGLKENPAELVGIGPIPASLGRILAADAKWRKFITDPLTGNLLDMGRESYFPSQLLADFLSARDRTCRFPGCSQPTRVGDIDHAIPWDAGGQTNRENLGYLCRRHHRMKTHGGWKLESGEDGSCTWISPHGKQYYVPSRPLQSL